MNRFVLQGEESYNSVRIFAASRLERRRAAEFCGT